MMELNLAAAAGWRSPAHMADIADITPTVWLIHEEETWQIEKSELVCMLSIKFVWIWHKHWLIDQLNQIYLQKLKQRP